MEDIYNPEDAFVTTLGTFTLFGLWPSAVKHPLLSVLYKIYGFIYQSLYIMALLPSQLINIYHMRGNLRNLVESSFFTLTCAGYTTKLFLFLLRRKEIENFLKRLHQPIFAPQRKEHFIILKKWSNIAKVNSLVYLALCLFTCVWWIMYPFVDKSQEERVLLFAAWYPFDTSKNTVYTYTYIFQTVLLLTTASMASMMDMLVANFYVLMLGQIEILKQDFKLLTVNDTNDFVSSTNCEYSTDGNNIKKVFSVQEEKIFHENDVNHLLKENTSINDDNLYKNYDFHLKTLHNRIIRCTKHYDAIVDLVTDVTNLFQIGIVVQVCASSIVICVTCYELTSLSSNTLQFYVILQYQICMLIQIFIYTWRGNNIIVKTSELKDAVYECSWTSITDKKFRKSLCIIMSRFQKAIKLRVGNFFLLSVDTFFNILRSAYSFFILLKQVHVTE